MSHRHRVKESLRPLPVAAFPVALESVLLALARERLRVFEQIMLAHDRNAVLIGDAAEGRNSPAMRAPMSLEKMTYDARIMGSNFSTSQKALPAHSALRNGQVDPVWAACRALQCALDRVLEPLATQRSSALIPRSGITAALH
jgi:hypothetical protein